MTNRDDEIVALLRELVTHSKENVDRYAMAVKRQRRAQIVIVSSLLLGIPSFSLALIFKLTHYLLLRSLAPSSNSF
jgi:hypothetical protein